MNKLLTSLLVIILLSSCKNMIDEEYVITQFQENSGKIDAMEFRVHKIDTFTTEQRNVWNNTGFAIIEKDEKDKLFGFSFYGKRDDSEKEYIYDSENGNGYEISKKDKTYEVEPNPNWYHTTSGGQMIPSNILVLDSIYKKVSLKVTDKTYILTYELYDDTSHNILDRINTVELKKDTFLPIKLSRSSNRTGNKASTQITLSDIKINEEVSKSIEQVKKRLEDYKIIHPEKRPINKLISKKLPLIKLPNLLDTTDIVAIHNNKITLIDFWEFWCGPCIGSFPKVEQLKDKYSSQLNIIGIMSDNPEKAIKIVKEREITFLNLIGNDELQKTFSVDSWPRYFLIDKDGVLQKEYFGFSEQIEKDIKELISK